MTPSQTRPRGEVSRAAARPPRRRRCRNCGELFHPIKPNQVFCSNAQHRREDGGSCKDEYHRFGAAYGPLKDQLERLIARTVARESAARFQGLEARVGELTQLAEELGQMKRRSA